MRKYLIPVVTSIVTTMLMLAVPLIGRQAVDTFETIVVENDLVVDGEVLLHEFAGMRVIGANDGTCPNGFDVDTSFQGRMIVGTPSGGTNGGTSGPVLTNREVRRGGSAAGLNDGTWPSTATSGLHKHIFNISHSSGSEINAPQNEAGILSSNNTSDSGSHTHTLTGGAWPTYTDQLQPAPYIQVPICAYNP